MRRTPPLLLTLCALTTPSWARAPSSGEQVEQGLATSSPPRLLNQVLLDYPADAPAGLHGDVVVLVDVSADGSVAGVLVLEGPQVFYGSARDAALRLRFAPAERDGVARASQARITFHFAPPVDDDAPIDEIVVHSDDPDRGDPRARTALDADTLERGAADDLAQQVSQVPGVIVASGSSDTSKPIIRGQSERRLLVLVDGVRHESQKWGADHGTEVDAASAGQITVVRGAAGARYGPDAIGGVLLVQSADLPSEPGVSGRAVTAYNSNGRQGYAGARLDWVPRPGLGLRLEGNVRRGGTLRAPDYVLGNTASSVWNLGGTAEVVSGGRSLKVSAHHHDLRAGVFYGVRSATPDAFRDLLQADLPPNAASWTPGYAIDRPLQDVTHDRVTVDGHAYLGRGWHLDGIYAFQRNHRQELDTVRQSVTGPQFDFVLRTHSLDFEVHHDAIGLGRGFLTGGIGVQGLFQENVYRGLPLLPNYRGLGGGIFAHERLALGAVDVVAGARLDGLARTAYLGELDYERHARAGTLDASTCTVSGDVARCPAAYPAATLSLGAVVHAVPEHVDVKLDLSSASRFPNVDELYLIGAAPTLPVYAQGNPGLGAETTWSGSGTVAGRWAWLDVEVSGWASRVPRYIHFAPDLGPNDAVQIEVTARGAFPRFTYTTVDARQSGVDGFIEVGRDAVVGLRAQGSVVRAVDAVTGFGLVGIPADRARVRLAVRPPWGQDLELAVTSEHIGTARVAPQLELAPPPEGTVLLGAEAQATVHVGHRDVRLGLSAHNLLDTAYREYTSLLRYYADQPGRDVRLRVGLDI